MVRPMSASFNPQLHAAFHAALADNVDSLLDALSVIAIELRTAGLPEPAAFFAGLATAVRVYAAAEGLRSTSASATAATNVPSEFLS